VPIYLEENLFLEIREVMNSISQIYCKTKQIFEWFLDKNTNIWQTVNAFNNYFSDFEAFLTALLKALLKGN